MQVQEFGYSHTSKEVSYKGKGLRYRTKHRQFIFHISVGKHDLWGETLSRKGKHSVNDVNTGQPEELT